MNDHQTKATNPPLIIAEKLRQQIDAGDVEVPLLPEVARKVMELLQTPDADSVRLAKLIQGDQSLAAHVMRVANSAAYSPSSSLVSLQQAIARLGINLIGEIAMAASVNSKLFNVAAYQTHVQGIWRHALATALWCKEISRQCRKNVEATFLCGLLFSIGRPVALQMIVDLCKSTKLSLAHDQVLMLENQFEREISQYVLKKWAMPAVIIETTRHVGDFKNAPRFPEQAAIVTAASKFAAFMLYPDSIDAESLAKEEALGFLNLYQDDVQRLFQLQSAVTETMNSLAA